MVMDFNGFLCVRIGLYSILCNLVGPNGSLYVLMCLYGS